jgi:hypothetical protein
MRAYEIAKNDADIPRGRVMMAVEGLEDAVAAIVIEMGLAGYPSTQCADVGDNDGEIIEYFMIARGDKIDFMNNYRAVR